jgi:hypothetical protein
MKHLNQAATLVIDSCYREMTHQTDLIIDLLQKNQNHNTSEIERIMSDHDFYLQQSLFLG